MNDSMNDIMSLVIEKLEKGEKVYLDGFGIEWVEKVKEECPACGSDYKRTHGGWGSICYECQEPWNDDQDDD